MKVGIVGTGSVGSSAAYAMIMTGTASEVVLIDPDEGMAQAQAEDLEDSIPFANPVRISCDDFRQLSGAHVVVLACGVRSRPGESRLDLLSRNAEIFRKVAPLAAEQASGAILLVVSNPVDILTDLVCRWTGFPPGRVFGTGTTLDTARFRARLGCLLGVTPRSVHGYVLGEHGDSEVLVWSSAAVGGVPLAQFAAQAGRPLTPEFRQRVDEGVRHAAARIIRGKGATCYGIGAAVARIVKAVRDDERALLTVTAPSPEMELQRPPCLSLPRVVGSMGVERTVFPSLSPGEWLDLERSASILLEAAGSVA